MPGHQAGKSVVAGTEYCIDLDTVALVGFFGAFPFLPRNFEDIGRLYLRLGMRLRHPRPIKPLNEGGHSK